MRFRRFVGLLVANIGILAFCQDHPDKIRLCFVGPNDLADMSSPKFEQYAVGTSPLQSIGKLDLQSNPVARMYRTVIRQQMKEGPNFANHYLVAIWGCGTSCAQFAVVNLENGRVITPKGVVSVSGDHFMTDGFLPSTDSEGWGFRYKHDSRLLVLVGTINEDDSREGAFYYELAGDELKLVHKTIAHRNTCKYESVPDWKSPGH
jgi:hypothetical protein